MKFTKNYFILISTWVYLSVSCKKLVEIDPPASTIVTKQAFQDSANASSSILGIYGAMMNTSISFMNGILTIDLGKSADELKPYQSSGDRLYSNTLIVSDGSGIAGDIWSPAYVYIYQANACIEGVQASTGINETTKKQFVGEAKFLRTLCYFYLTNLYGDIPFVTSTDYRANQPILRKPQAEIYQQLISDLLDAQNFLPKDYSISGGDRTRANYWAATALLARIYLYLGDWENAEKQASLVLSQTGLFVLNTDLNGVFLRNSLGNNEPILQWSMNTQTGFANVTPEGVFIIPYAPPNNLPPISISDQLLNAFEDGDLRRSKWLDSTAYGDPIPITYYFPYKYKIGITQANPGGDATEYVTILRLAEQYLIRAEARAQKNNMDGAIDDLNIIRERAGLDSLPYTNNQQTVFASVAQERRIELFAEWGHRWLDLKRTGKINDVMTVATPLKGQGSEWANYQQLFPIPPSEILTDPNLTQNQGY